MPKATTSIQEEVVSAEQRHVDEVEDGFAVIEEGVFFREKRLRRNGRLLADLEATKESLLLGALTEVGWVYSSRTVVQGQRR